MTDIGLPLRVGPGSAAADLAQRAARIIMPPIAAASLLIAGWELASQYGLTNPRLVPAPSKVYATFVRSLDVLLDQALPTLWGALAGIVIAALTGILLGAAISYSRTLMRAIYPTVVFFQLIPKVALAPVFLLWFGTGLTANIIFSVFIAFFPVLVATIAGFRAMPSSYEGLCHSLMMSKPRMFAVVKFPFALPHIFSGLRIGVTFAVIGVVLGEFMTAQAGLGYIILFSANNFETALLLSAIVVLCAVGGLLFAFFLLLEAMVIWVYDTT